VLSHSGSPMVAGEQTAAAALIRFIGARNALGGFQGYRPMTAEAMAQAAPDVILTTTQGIEAIGGEASFWQRPELALTPAYQRRTAAGALVHLDALELLGFGPRLPDVVERLHERLVRA
ncbi:MAG: ABC transporter substrate-binding protein, partial [Hydrogenophaga sp.]